MEKPIAFKALDKFVLSPGAEYFVIISRRYFSNSPEEIAEMVELDYGIEKQNVLDFLYDRIPLDDKLAKLFIETSSYKKADVQSIAQRKALYNRYLEKKQDENYTVIGLEDLLGTNIRIDDSDVDDICSRIQEVVDSCREEKSGLEEIKKLLLEAWSKLQNLGVSSYDWAESVVLKEYTLAQRVILAEAILRQRSKLNPEEQTSLLAQVRKLTSWTSDTKNSGCHGFGLLDVLKDLEQSVLSNMTNTLRAGLYFYLSGSEEEGKKLPWFRI